MIKTLTYAAVIALMAGGTAFAMPLSSGSAANGPANQNIAQLNAQTARMNAKVARLNAETARENAANAETAQLNAKQLAHVAPQSYAYNGNGSWESAAAPNCYADQTCRNPSPPAARSYTQQQFYRAGVNTG